MNGAGFVKLCRFGNSAGSILPGLVADEESVMDISAEFPNLAELLESENLAADLKNLADGSGPRYRLAEVRMACPVDRQEIWAAGVTYLRSKKARVEESDFSAQAYDRVYEAARPELFFKSLPEKVVGPGKAVGVRADAKWSVPEPELALAINSRGEVVGYTAGNDMSSRDIEGENLLYLPQAKIYEGSCAVGPVIVCGASERDARGWKIELVIQRGGRTVFKGNTSAGNIKRSFAELSQYLFRSQRFPNGVILLTGTGVVPPNEFTLEPGDRIRISIAGIGTLENSVVSV
jgi:2-dehydro-3-deoxy-D-arabinonate dehydratase